MRKFAVGAVVLGLALSACSTDGEGPQIGGVAAEVNGTTISLDEVDTLTDAYCKVQTAQGAVSPRSTVSDGAASILVQLAIVEEFDLATDVTSPVTSEQIPGWGEMDAAEREAIRGWLDAQQRIQAALIELGREGATSAEAAQQQGAAILESRIAEELEITVNPRYEFQVVDGAFTQVGSLSVPVSDEATATADDSEQYRSLPESQRCGAAPEQAPAG